MENTETRTVTMTEQEEVFDDGSFTVQRKVHQELEFVVDGGSFLIGDPRNNAAAWQGPGMMMRQEREAMESMYNHQWAPHPFPPMAPPNCRGILPGGEVGHVYAAQMMPHEIQWMQAYSHFWPGHAMGRGQPQAIEYPAAYQHPCPCRTHRHDHTEEHSGEGGGEENTRGHYQHSSDEHSRVHIQHSSGERDDENSRGHDRLSDERLSEEQSPRQGLGQEEVKCEDHHPGHGPALDSGQPSMDQSLGQREHILKCPVCKSELSYFPDNGEVVARSLPTEAQVQTGTQVPAEAHLPKQELGQEQPRAKGTTLALQGPQCSRGPGQDLASGHHQGNGYGQPLRVQGRRKKEPTFKCHICEKAFTTNYNLQRHIRTHTAEKPFACPECNKCFSEKPKLNHHLRTHSRERPHQCEVCTKWFTRMDALNRHRQVHQPERSLKEGDLVKWHETANMESQPEL